MYNASREFFPQGAPLSVNSTICLGLSFIGIEIAIGIDPEPDSDFDLDCFILTRLGRNGRQCRCAADRSGYQTNRECISCDEMPRHLELSGRTPPCLRRVPIPRRHGGSHTCQQHLRVDEYPSGGYLSHIPQHPFLGLHAVNATQQVMPASLAV